jgi:hypothetical protein
MLVGTHVLQQEKIWKKVKSEKLYNFVRKNPMDWSQQVYLHQHDLKALKLKTHPDKNGTGFAELNAYLEKISQYHNWEELVELAQSAQEIQDLYIGNYRYDPHKKSKAIEGKKLTMQMIVDYIHQEFSKAETILKEFSSSHDDREFSKRCEYKSCTFPRYESNSSFRSHMFSREHLNKHLDILINDLQAIKSNMQKNQEFNQFYWYFDKSPRWKESLDVDFDWVSILNEKMARLENKSSSIVFYLLSPNFSSEMHFRDKPRSLLEEYEFLQLKEIPKRKLPLVQKNANKKPKTRQDTKIDQDVKLREKSLLQTNLIQEKKFDKVDILIVEESVNMIEIPIEIQIHSNESSNVVEDNRIISKSKNDYRKTTLGLLICDLKICLESGKIEKSKGGFYSQSTIRGYISTLQKVLPKYGENVGDWLNNRGKFSEYVQKLPKNEKGQAIEHGKTNAALNIFWKFLKITEH